MRMVTRVPPFSGLKRTSPSWLTSESAVERHAMSSWGSLCTTSEVHSTATPAGVLGHAVAAMFGADPKSEMDADLMRMKHMIETGKPPHDAAQPLEKLAR